ncbi:MAG TPA: hypothetical protein VFS43_39595 [Polyangiaceae bacterium]|nr:hypothetical protein [Polyangiaceae bacterium]
MAPRTPSTSLAFVGLGTFALVAAILGIVFFLVGKALDRARAGLEAEGVVKAPDRVIITTRFDDFRSPQLRSSGIRKNHGYLVLTRERLIVLQLPQRYGGLYARGALGRLRVGVDERGALQLHTDEPPGATGSVDYRVPVRDAAAWVKALVEAGARAA